MDRTLTGSSKPVTRGKLNICWAKGHDAPDFVNNAFTIFEISTPPYYSRREFRFMWWHNDWGIGTL